jgi:hypothetical protein
MSILAVILRQNHGPADREAKLILLHRWFCGLKEITRVQLVVAQILAQASVEGVRSTAGNGIDHRAASGSIASAVIRCLDLDFFECFDHRHMGIRLAIAEVDVERPIHEPTRGFVVQPVTRDRRTHLAQTRRGKLIAGRTVNCARHKHG